MTRSIGESYDPLGTHLQDPYPFFALARETEPVFYSEVLRAWVVTRFDDVRTVLQQHETFSTANALRSPLPLHPDALAVLERGFPPSSAIINVNGDRHLKVRAPLAKRLGTDAVAAMEPEIRKRATALVDALAADGSAELMSQYARVLPVDTISDMCGIAAEDRAIIRDGAYACVAVITGGASREEEVEAAELFLEFQQVMARYVRECRTRPGPDAFSEIAGVLAPAGPLDDEQLAELVWTFIGLITAGHSTTTALLGNGLWHLLSRPDQWQLLCRRPELIPGAVEEIARYDTPVHAFFRVTTREVTLGGRTLEAGADVVALYSAANRDPEEFDQPETFDITRQITRHLTFGHGVHACVGARLARLQLAVTLEALTTRLPGLRLVPDSPVRMARQFVDHAPVALHVAW
ncbi:cytochrome P450 [Streptomyces davaonensis JCM 4913]|uniref:Cytochrome P450 n=1 Tax=Streptomyces davaonensis (strain DSM 101723 / JCM 4913 / KCC S-0913 / 768) TaxID=1214101 RepID=K4QYF3_STRDJ|nr:cytochrome P450 [Streptomyces davaonensis]CCK25399.1 cytochrome P450 [Streptomyces davaonensis JCM 4913]